MLPSISIPTLDSRRSRFSGLRARLLRQIAAAGCEGQVEVLRVSDNGEQPTGRKRNQFLERARGEFSVFVDDDDAVSPRYVELVCGAIRRRPENCIGITGQITFPGGHPHTFVHSVRYRDYSSAGNLNPMRRDIAAAYRFRKAYPSDRRLRSKERIESVLYYYNCRRLYAYQWLLDRTEGIRHRYGLQMANRFRFLGKAALEYAARTEARP